MRSTLDEFRISFDSTMRGTFDNRKPAFLGGLCTLSLLLALSVAGPVQDCDKSKCKGPIKFYEDLNCKPVYEKESACCAARYDCSHLTSARSENKCYANGHEYAVGEELRDEDRSSPCDRCTCIKAHDHNMAMFNCAIVDCFNQMMIQDGCFFRRDMNSCCGGQEVCPKNKEDRLKCEVDGETYLDGQEFTPKSDPSVYCQCMEGYKGENVEPFCKPIKCGTEIRHTHEVIQKCAPVFYSGQSPRTNCHAIQYRCQNQNDTVLPVASEKSPEDKPKESTSKDVPDEMKCKFGNMSMLIGEELNQATDYDSVCVKCVCEVPPIPTCQRLAESECDVTDHPPFD